MRFSIELPGDNSITPVWNDPAALENLDSLISRAENAVHEIFLRDADLVSDSLWVVEARQTKQTKLKALLELARTSAWTAAEAKTKSWRITTEAEAKRALCIANTPLKVLVENSFRDGALLEAAVRLLGKKTLRQLWLKPPVPAAVAVAGSGGTGDMPSFIARECTEAQERDLPVRMIVVADSDRLALDQPLSDKSKKIQEKAAEHGVPCVILSKREGENYLPDFYWQAEIKSDSVSPEQKRKISELFSMPVKERDYCNMKGSLKKHKKVPDGYKTPYHLEILLERVKQAQSSELDAMAADLRRRDHTGDLTAILNLIEQER
jgi:hypothetical protein